MTTLVTPNPSRVPLAWISASLGGYALMGGLLTLLGWAIDFRRLTDWNNSGISQMPNNAVCVAVTGAALVLLSFGRHRAATVLGAVAGLIGAATLSQYFTGVDLGIDKLLIYRDWGQRGTVVPGRMGPPGSTSLAILGLSIILRNDRRTRKWTVVGALVVVAIAILSIMGYLFGASMLYTLPKLTTIAFQTATMLLALGVGLILTVPEYPPMRTLLRDDSASLLVKSALPGVILLPIVLGWLSLRGQQSGLVDAAFGTALSALVLMILLMALLWWLARALRIHETAMRDSRERLSDILGSITDAFVTFDTHWRIVFLNQQMEARLGMSRSDLIGKNIREVLPDSALTETYRQLQRGMSERVSVEYEVFYSPWQKWFAERAYPTADGGIAVFSRDITDRKQAEDAVRDSERQLRLATDYAPVLIAHCDTEGRYKFVNRPYAARFGLQPKDVIGKRIPEVIGREAYATFERRVAEVVAGNTVEFEVEIPYETGGTQFMHCAYVPERDGKTVIGFVAAILNITERKRAEEALKKSEGEQRALANLLRQQAAELSEADRRKNEFLAILAHELRNPLAPIRNGLQILKLAKDDVEATEQSRVMMERQLAQMVRLIDDLMDVSRITRGKVELRRERVELAKVIQQAVETSRPLIEAKEHDLTISVPSHPIIVDADVTRLTQVLSNLLNNAAKYSEPGGQITLTVEWLGNDVVVSVSDTGIGIPPDMLPKVFDLFTQVDHSLEKSQGGLGIGLSLVKALIEMHGGTVEARSDGSGQGSEFVVRLPVDVAAMAKSKPIIGEDALSFLSARRRILVADDNVDSAITLAMLLKVMGHEVRTAHDGLQAAKVATEFQPNVILLDIGMPKLNGYEACRRIRQEPWAENTVLIALTGWGQEDDRRQSKDAGFSHHLVKPVDPMALNKLLNGLKAETM